MAKEQVLRFKPARRLEEVDDEHCEQMQEREHRPRSCDDSTRRCDSQAGIDVRDADFQRGLNKAVENRWIKVKLRDRYTYELTEAGLAAGLNAGLPPKPLG